MHHWATQKNDEEPCHKVLRHFSELPGTMCHSNGSCCSSLLALLLLDAELGCECELQTISSFQTIRKEPVEIIPWIIPFQALVVITGGLWFLAPVLYCTEESVFNQPGSWGRVPYITVQRRSTVWQSCCTLPRSSGEPVPQLHMSLKTVGWNQTRQRRGGAVGGGKEHIGRHA